MYKFLNISILVLLFCGCATAYDNKDRFVRHRDYDVGRSVDLSYATPSEIISNDENYNKYLYEGEGGCKWVYFVNKRTKIVESWEYVLQISVHWGLDGLMDSHGKIENDTS